MSLEHAVYVCTHTVPPKEQRRAWVLSQVSQILSVLCFLSPSFPYSFNRQWLYIERSKSSGPGLAPVRQVIYFSAMSLPSLKNRFLSTWYVPSSGERAQNWWGFCSYRLWVIIGKTINEWTRKFTIIVNIVKKIKFFSVVQSEERKKKERCC